MHSPDEDELVGPLNVGPIAHGGHCVARLEGRVIFVRDTIPGEKVLARLVDTTHDHYWWARAERIIEASPHRVRPPCPVAGSCGGCDFQHVELSAQRGLKAAVVAEQLQRLAGVKWQVLVQQVPGDDAGLSWRTRMRYLTAADGHSPTGSQVGLRAWHSDRLVELPAQGCLIADRRGPSVAELKQFADRYGELQVCVADDVISVKAKDEQVAGPKVVKQRVRTREFQVAADGFWQVHPGAAEVLTRVVLEQLQPQPGEGALDLYCGVGLFAGALVDAGCQVTGVELSKLAAKQAKQNVPQATFIAGPLERNLVKLPTKTDIIVLDPPRTGAGRQVVRKLAATNARAISYVACDPAALARDIKTFAELGWELTELRAFDLFPMTHHVECVAKLTRR